jgi:hypothetical protein
LRRLPPPICAEVCNHADASQDQQIDRIVQTFNVPSYSPIPVDFPFAARWVNQGYLSAPDYPGNWPRYELATMADALKHNYDGQLPDHFRGIMLDVDPGCRHLRYVFGRYPDGLWRCDGFLKTQYAERGFCTHAQVVGLLHELEPMVDYLDVHDETRLWETGDLAAAAFRFERCGSWLDALSRAMTAP